MTQNKTFVTSSSNSGLGINSSSPNGDKYTFNISQKTSLALLNPIILTVTGDFGYLSICALNGYRGGQNLITYI